MRGVFGFVTLIVVIVATLAHIGLYRWLLRAFPALTKGRFLLAALLTCLCALPLLRAIPYETLSPLRRVAPASILWHLTVALTMLVVAFSRGLYALWEMRPTATPPAPLPDAPQSPSRRVVLERAAGVGAFAITGGTVSWGTFVGRTSFRVEEVVVRIPRLPRTLDGFTIAQISDIHVGPFVGERDLARGLAFVRDLKPDLVAITGDILDSDPRFIPLAARALGELRARFGVVAIPGNHDYYTGSDEVIEGLQRAGVEVLVNRGIVIEGGLAILGVDDLFARRNHRMGPDLKRAMATVRPDLATVLLAHQPVFFDEARSIGGVDLQLSGHTHGGQINPGFTPAKAVLRYIAGRYDQGGSTLYVNRGFGTAGPPCRIGAPPEVTKIILVSA